ncbi:hypothetical protein L799_01790 [Enterobacter roggenkampii EC_38VIM1]|jgi:hypothetical protein|nr:hypothetical protein L799_01790 [Enterobacter roggenkampii EC_38VIM1]
MKFDLSAIVKIARIFSGRYYFKGIATARAFQNKAQCLPDIF